MTVNEIGDVSPFLHGLTPACAAVLYALWVDADHWEQCPIVDARRDRLAVGTCLAANAVEQAISRLASVGALEVLEGPFVRLHRAPWGGIQ